jgi:hypothetical protein
MNIKNVIHSKDFLTIFIILSVKGILKGVFNYSSADLITSICCRSLTIVFKLSKW